MTHKQRQAYQINRRSDAYRLIVERSGEYTFDEIFEMTARFDQMATSEVHFGEEYTRLVCGGQTASDFVTEQTAIDFTRRSPRAVFLQSHTKTAVRARLKRLKAVERMRRKGATYDDIGAVLSVSRGRARQLVMKVERLKQSGEWPPTP